MFKNLLHCSGETCVRIGRRILSRLRVDPRLAGTAAEFTPAQESLEVRATARANAEEVERNARDARGQAAKDAVSALRKFGLEILGSCGNRHDAERYLRYFSEGYGSVAALDPSALPGFASVILGILADETDPHFLAYREPITTARDALLSAESAHRASVQARSETYAYLEAEKRLWARALMAARFSARVICIGEDAYLRSLFAPATRRRARNSAEVVDEPGQVTSGPGGQSVAETPSEASSDSMASSVSAGPARASS